jgi:hypothetical protein
MMITLPTSLAQDIKLSILSNLVAKDPTKSQH